MAHRHKHRLNHFWGGWNGIGIPWATRPRYGVDYIPNRVLIPNSVDLRPEFPPIRDQGQLGSCTAFATTGALQHMAMKEALATGSIEPSELAFYFCERQVDGDVSEDAGSTLSTAAKVSMQIGCLREDTWPYDISKFTETPPNAGPGDIIDLDTLCPSIPQDELAIKTALSEGFGVFFGVSVYQSFEDATGGRVPLPDLTNEQLLGGHAIVLVGYSDPGSVFFFRNSWGAGWGMGGYGTLPYAYVLSPDLASDFWSPRLVK